MKRILLFLFLAILVGSCASKKDLVYFRDIDSATLKGLDSVYEPPTIQPKDILKIDLTALEPESTFPYMFDKMEAAMASSSRKTQEDRLLEGYLINKDGVLNYPGLGAINLEGKTTNEAQEILEKELSKYIKNPSVRVRLVNFKVTVLGKVMHPGTYTSSEEALTIPQALGMAGDLDIQGRRRNILLIRQVDGERFARRIDLTKTAWMDDPSYYLKQNDIIYVEPNGAAVKSAGFINSFAGILSSISVLVSIAILAFK